MERPFDIQIEKLRTKLIKMCSLVDEQVDFAIKSITEKNIKLADLVIEREKEVDGFDIKIEKICQNLFALNQPVASDLRLIMSALKINSNLERIGDLAAKLSYNSKEILDWTNFYDIIDFDLVSNSARKMVKNSIDSFINNDDKLAVSVIKSDNKLDAIIKENQNKLILIMKEDSSNIESAIKLHTIFDIIEKLGDHSTNICEEVYFILTAESLKHKNDIESED